MTELKDMFGDEVSEETERWIRVQDALVKGEALDQEDITWFAETAADFSIMTGQLYLELEGLRMVANNVLVNLSMVPMPKEGGEQIINSLALLAKALGYEEEQVGKGSDEGLLQ